VGTRDARFHLTPIPFTQVSIEDEFWAPRIAVNRERSIPAVYQQLKAGGRIDAFGLDWRPGKGPAPHIFWDSDVAKWVEGLCYDLALYPDPERAQLLEEVTSLIASAQQPDGYLNVHFTVVAPEKRWSNLRDDHELYCAGHLLEAALAHSRVTGKRALLEAMLRYVQHIGSVFGPEQGKKRGYCGHEEIELALLKLYRVTGDAAHLHLAQYFLEERGQEPNYFAQEAVARGEEEPQRVPLHYLQAHLPIREQTEATGHAVRAVYLYSAMAELARATNDATLAAACERLWESAARRMYLTGGIGSAADGERFTTDYDLPNDTAYAETCAAIGLVFFSHRMLQQNCNGRYGDAMERALYNGVLSGVSLDGKRFFYENPLASEGKHHRQEWFNCACCPTNLVRVLPTIGGYVYSTGDRELAVHLYVQSEGRLSLPNGTPLTVRQETRYPWEGRVRLTLTPAAPAEFTLRLRVPGWCRSYTLAVNNTAVKARRQRGYACLTRAWQPGEVVTLELAMPVELMEAHPEVTHDFGRLALQRGPLVYCLEDVDHAVSVAQLAIPGNAKLRPRFAPDLLGGVMALEGAGQAREGATWDGALYRPRTRGRRQPTPLRAIPYCLWDNRAPGAMRVWLPRA
jgi:DUF1680 family protein